jgi:DNA-binding response OmpR family regulator
MCTPTEDTTGGRPALVVAHQDHVFTALVSNAFRQRGWDVHLTYSGPDARRLARTVSAAAVVLDANLRDESGWLTCAKLSRELPHVRVILVSPGLSPEGCRFATFVGAARLVNRKTGIRNLVEEVCQPAPAGAELTAHFLPSPLWG